ncbi:hypothetical protein [Aurantimonas marina]|uniref:hypothetical protein n=1 Tax=Aurantimonas marina TaxID=2780508 RepID=UPI0019D157D4|nr:hypothetical protein [Aurantimonas marina]
MASAEKITDHDEIRAWAKKTGGKPAMVAATENGEGGPGILRVDHGRDDEGLEEIDWDRFFEAFEQNRLALLIDPSGDNPNFNKFVSRD